MKCSVLILGRVHCFFFFYGDYKSRLSLKEYIITVIIIHRSGATTSCKYDETLTRKKRPFLLQIAPGHRSLKYNTDLPPPSHSMLVLQVLSMVLYC